VPAAQAWQAGQLALPQQTPSTQLPLWHWLPAAQVTPEPSLAVHAPTGRSAQKLPAEQSPSAAHVARQAVVPLQVYAPQVCVVRPHVPPPHVPAFVSVDEVPGHEAGEQVAPSGYF
jgi:hypothetical protein